MPFRIMEVSSPHDKFDIEWRSNDHTSATVSSLKFHHSLISKTSFENSNRKWINSSFGGHGTCR